VKPSNPFNPLNWIRSTQDFFLKSERSSGFRPYLIFFVVLCSFDLTLLVLFKDNPQIQSIAETTLYIGVIGFVVIFAIKSFQDPDFCRSEKHVETVKRIELTEKKGDAYPTVIDISSSPTIPKSEIKGIIEGEEK
jgi:hypothetical protein